MELLLKQCVDAFFKIEVCIFCDRIDQEYIEKGVFCLFFNTHLLESSIFCLFFNNHFKVVTQRIFYFNIHALKHMFTWVLACHSIL